MLDIQEGTGSENQKIQHPACRGEALKERRLESSIQDHAILPMIFITNRQNPRKYFYAI